jgi:hypothetical protein
MRSVNTRWVCKMSWDVTIESWHEIRQRRIFVKHQTEESTMLVDGMIISLPCSGKKKEYFVGKSKELKTSWQILAEFSKEGYDEHNGHYDEINIRVGVLQEKAKTRGNLCLKRINLILF